MKKKLSLQVKNFQAATVVTLGFSYFVILNYFTGGSMFLIGTFPFSILFIIGVGFLVAEFYKKISRFRNLIFIYIIISLVSITVLLAIHPSHRGFALTRLKRAVIAISNYDKLKYEDAVMITDKVEKYLALYKYHNHLPENAYFIHYKYQNTFEDSVSFYAESIKKNFNIFNENFQIDTVFNDTLFYKDIQNEKKQFLISPYENYFRLTRIYGQGKNIFMHRVSYDIYDEFDQILVSFLKFFNFKQVPKKDYIDRKRIRLK